MLLIDQHDCELRASINLQVFTGNSSVSTHGSLLINYDRSKETTFQSKNYHFSSKSIRTRSVRLFWVTNCDFFLNGWKSSLTFKFAQGPSESIGYKTTANRAWLPIGMSPYGALGWFEVLKSKTVDRVAKQIWPSDRRIGFGYAPPGRFVRCSRLPSDRSLVDRVKVYLKLRLWFQEVSLIRSIWKRLPEWAILGLKGWTRRPRFGGFRSARFRTP